MPDENQILVHQFEHNLWANDQMLAACAPLTPEQLATELAGTYGRLDQTLIHLARAQGGYVMRLTDWQPGLEHQLEYDAPFPGIEAVASHLRFTGERLVEVAREITPNLTLQLEYEGEMHSLPAWVVLLQAAYHATEHRQQVATMLTGLGIEPPEPDLWAFAEREDG
jgi:uncharacterized damage-inducible protein DinB